MEKVNNRECEITELSNGDKIFVLTEYKAREYRQLVQIQAKSTSMQDDEVKVDNSKFIGSLDDIIKLIILKVTNKDGKDVIIDSTYLDGLDIQDYIVIQDMATNAINSILGGKKKDSKSK